MTSPSLPRPGAAALLLTLIAAGAAAPLSAQHHHPRGLREVEWSHRRGFWVGLGLGAGQNSTRFSPGPDLWSDGIDAGSAYLKLGGTPSDNVLLGAELYIWAHDLGRGIDESLTSAMFITQVYPFDRAGLYFKGGLGLASTNVDDGFADFSESGYGGVLGIGYEFRVGGNVYLVPTGDIYWHSYDDRRERIVNLGLGITFH